MRGGRTGGIPNQKVSALPWDHHDASHHRRSRHVGSSLDGMWDVGRALLIERHDTVVMTITERHS